MDISRTYAEIDLDAVLHNFDELKGRVSGGVKCCCVIKADAYGHGAVTVAKALEEKADHFAVAMADEAMELRRAGVSRPVLILSYTDPADHEELIENGVGLTVFTLGQALRINEAAARIGKTARVHIALDTGMTRIGFRPGQAALDDVKTISGLDSTVIEGIFSHYATADCADKSFAKVQTELFESFCAACEKEGVDTGIKHICNSAGISEFSDHFDMVRMGIALYGLYPSEDVNRDALDLIPVMTLKSRIINIREVPAGTGVSYGHTWHAGKETVVATVCAGYADGYPRAMSNRGRVMINGRFAPIIGRVCMDQFMVDVSGIPDARVGGEVTLWGGSGDPRIPVEEIGAASESFNYEVICGVSRRVPRVYIKDGDTAGHVNYLR